MSTELIVGLLGILSTFAGGLVVAAYAFNLQKKETERVKWKTDMETRMSAIEASSKQQELDAKDLVSGSDLKELTKEIFQEMKDIRTDFKTDLQVFQNNVLQALTGHKPG